MESKHFFCKYGLIGEDLDLKQNVELEIDDTGKILNIYSVEIEKSIELSPDHQNYIIIPGFINSHIHIGDSFAKELGFNKELKEIVAPPFGLKHKLLRQIPQEVKIKGIQNAVLEMLSNGITFFVDFREEGVRGVNLLKKSLSNYPINYLILGRFMDESEIDPIFEISDGVGLSSYKLITSSNKNFVSSAKKKFRKIIACHCAENTRNTELIKKIFEDNLVDVIIHGTKFTTEDLVKLIENKISLVLCPRSNGYLGTGFPPISEIIKVNIPISLGTDNLMVNNTDLFEEMRYLYRISRVLCKNKKEFYFTSKELLKMVTINAAKNFNLEREFGSISKGKFADFFIIDLDYPNLFVNIMDPINIYDLITQRVKSENILSTYIKGEQVFERI
ncbi:MAG: amidohydrolase family protein [Promethearchaeota archaeon]